MKKILLFCTGAFVLFACNNEKKDESADQPMVQSATTESSAAPISIADDKTIAIGKQMLDDMHAGNMDAWASHFSENAVYRWSSGDSLKGKQAILDYWKKRRSEVIDSISFNHVIWLPVKVNSAELGPDTSGSWLLGWNVIHVRYKNGKSLQFETHTAYHVNADGLINETTHYIDMAPINKALGK